MTGTEIDIRQKTDQVVATLNHPGVVEQIKESLPENVTLTRFVQIAKTAIRSNPRLVTADQNTLFASIIRCAQSGLYPDGKEAALVIYGDKVSFLPMIAGVTRQLAEFGWLLRTGVVRQGDEFDWSEEPMSLNHRPARPGVERGEIIYAWGIATHADGRRLQRVLNSADLAKRRAKAQTKGVWDEWPEPMSAKSAGHAVAKIVPLSEGDRARLDRVLAALDTDPADAAEQLYGPESVIEHVNLETGEITAGVASPTDTASADDGAASSGASQQAAAAVSPAAVAVPGEDDEPEPGPATTQADDLAEAARIAGTAEAVGNYKSMTIQQVHMLGDEGAEWFSYVLRHPAKYDDAFYAAVETFVQGLLPELYAVHTEWLAAREAA